MRWFLFPAATSPSPKGEGWERAGLRCGLNFLLLQAPPPKGEAGRGLTQTPPLKGGGWEEAFSFAADDARVLYLYIRRPPPNFNPQPQKNRVSSRNPHKMSLFTTSYHPLRHTKSSVSSHLFYPTLLIFNHFLNSINNIFR